MSQAGVTTFALSISQHLHLLIHFNCDQTGSCRSFLQMQTDLIHMPPSYSLSNVTIAQGRIKMLKQYPCPEWVFFSITPI